MEMYCTSFTGLQLVILHRFYHRDIMVMVMVILDRGMKGKQITKPYGFCGFSRLHLGAMEAPTFFYGHL